MDQQYEWTFHEGAALQEGAPQATVDAIKFHRDTEGLEDKDRLIIQYGREILRDHHLQQSTWMQANALFGAQGALEIAAIIGDYLLAAVILTAVDQQLPADRAPLMPE